MAPDRIHLFGASGSGTSTVGLAIAARSGHVSLDTDAFYWLPTDPPFRSPRAIPDRQRLLAAELSRRARWVLSGSLIGWGDGFVPSFDVVAYLEAPTAVRLDRLARREASRHGARIGPGGDMAAQHADFLAWAAAYEAGTREGRTRARHEAWIDALPPSLRFLRLDGTRPVDELVDEVLGLAPATPPVPPSPGR